MAIDQLDNRRPGPPALVGHAPGKREPWRSVIRGVTVAWIDAKDPTNWQLLDAVTPLPRVSSGQRVVPDRSGSTDVIGNRVRETVELLRLAEDTHVGAAGQERIARKRTDARSGLNLFYAERRPAFTKTTA